MDNTAYQYVKNDLAKKSMEWYKLQQSLIAEQSREHKDKLLLECRQLEKQMQHLIEVYNRYLNDKNMKKDIT